MSLFIYNLLSIAIISKNTTNAFREIFMGIWSGIVQEEVNEKLQVSIIKKENYKKL